MKSKAARLLFVLGFIAVTVLAIVGWTRPRPKADEGMWWQAKQPFSSQPAVMIGNWKDNSPTRSDSGSYIVRVKTDGTVSGWVKSDLTGQVSAVMGKFGEYPSPASEGPTLTLDADFAAKSEIPAYHEGWVIQGQHFMFGASYAACSMNYQSPSNRIYGCGYGYANNYFFLSEKDPKQLEREFGDVNQSNAYQMLERVGRLLASDRQPTFPYKV